MTARNPGAGDNGGPPLEAEDWCTPESPSFILPPWREYRGYNLINSYRYAAIGVFKTVLWTGTGVAQSLAVGFPPNLVIVKDRVAGGTDWRWVDSVRGATNALKNPAVGVETAEAGGVTSFDANGFSIGTTAGYNTNGDTCLAYCFRKLAGFFDIVTYTGTGANATVPHNLGVAPDLIIIKDRGVASDFFVYCSALATPSARSLDLTSNAAVGGDIWNSTAPSSSVFSLGSFSGVNGSARTYVAYLFATQADQCKVGGFTGNGLATGPSVVCGFVPSFVLIKAESSTSNWMVFDTARDPSPINISSALDSQTVEATQTYDVTVGAVSGGDGFQLTNAAASDLNVSARKYVFLAIK